MLTCVHYLTGDLIVEEDTNLYCSDNSNSDGGYSDGSNLASYSDSDGGYSDGGNLASYSDSDGGYSNGGYSDSATSDAAVAHMACSDNDTVLNHESAGLNKVAATWAIGAAALAIANPVAGAVAGVAAGAFWLWGSEKSEEAATNDDEAIRKCEEENQSH
jgi:hypothetical protein